MRVENARVRINHGSDADKLLAWGECILVDGEERFYFNNIRIKQKDVDKTIKLIFEYPHKLVNKNGLMEKKYFFKPVTKAAYNLVEYAFITAIKEELKRGCNGKE